MKYLSFVWKTILLKNNSKLFKKSLKIVFKKFTHILCQIVSQMASNTEQKERRSSIGKAIEIHNYINGEFEKSDKYFSSYNPALNRLNALIPDSDDQDVNRAVRAAKAAFER